jgi:hypothetical protein
MLPKAQSRRRDKQPTEFVAEKISRLGNPLFLFRSPIQALKEFWNKPALRQARRQLDRAGLAESSFFHLSSSQSATFHAFRRLTEN